MYDILIIFILVIVILNMFFLILLFIKNKSKKNIDRILISDIQHMERRILNMLNDNNIKMIKESNEQMNDLSNNILKTLEFVRSVNEKKLVEIREETEKKLDIIERNINEKLDKSLNERLDNSFKVVGEQLNNLHVSLGELHNLSNGVLDLQKMLTFNNKQRGIFGEKQLENILDNIMTKSQYEMQYRIKEDKDREVDFAIKIPNKYDNGFVYLPIDSKFPNDSYIKVVDAYNLGDKENLIRSQLELKRSVLLQAKSIYSKYLDPPITTDFALMFLPTESLYAECLRINGLFEDCQNNYRVLLVSPTTVTAIINSFSIGFKFLQVNKNSEKIMKTLQAIKAQFSNFSNDILETKERIRKASESTDKIARRNEIITSKLKSFDTLGIDESNNVLGIEENG